METLSPYQLTRAAPAAAGRRDATKNKLLDTPVFARAVATYDFQPVFATQAATHVDAKIARKNDGRHLVVFARPTGGALILVNSHTKDRKVRLGVGSWEADGGIFRVGAEMSLQRWKSIVEPVETALGWLDPLKEVENVLGDWSPTAPTMISYAGQIVRRAYLDGRSRPRPTVFSDAMKGETMLAAAFIATKLLREGGLPAATKGCRRIKGIQMPDALFTASKVVFQSAVAMARKNGRLRGHVTPFEG